MFHESTWSIHTCVNYFARLAHETVARMALSEPDEQGSVGQNGHSGTARPDSHESESWSMRSRSAYCKAKERKNQQDTKNRTGYASCGVADTCYGRVREVSPFRVHPFIVCTQQFSPKKRVEIPSTPDGYLNVRKVRFSLVC